MEKEEYTKEVIEPTESDRYLRLLADFENYKKRSQKEKEDIKNATKISLLNSILEIDNEMSIASNQIKNEEDRKGIKLILSKLERFLNSQGIESIQTEEYDSENHEVISIVPSDCEKIIDVVSKGYKINDKPFSYPKIILGKK